ncbi:hypothetical protein HPB52_024649 [Rhipicephalus sanguineus]|uniref:Uncharacterized protein n=1 Tax=Rhipicephalus sanguineus TaxID=34632 RepID=A0A9D4TE03_RHISA|nr:hypothetical protein HPB52_024649 [Rhipicephalus sanguineus]
MRQSRVLRLARTTCCPPRGEPPLQGLGDSPKLCTWEEASPPLEEQLHLSRQEERTLHSELTLARSQLATCEARLLQCRQRLCQLGHELAEEKRCQGGEEKTCRSSCPSVGAW